MDEELQYNHGDSSDDDRSLDDSLHRSGRNNNDFYNEEVMRRNSLDSMDGNRPRNNSDEG